MRHHAFLFAVVLAACGSGATGQSMQSAHDDGNAFGKAQGASAAGVADSTTTAQDTVPNYNGGNAPETTYENNPSALDANKATIASTNDAYRLTVDGNLARPQIPASVITSTLSSGNVIANDPATYAQGLANGSTGNCVALPPSNATVGTYEATCNKGLTLQQGPKSCAITTDVKVTNSGPPLYDYYVTSDNNHASSYSPYPHLSFDNWEFQNAINSGTCKVIASGISGCTAAVAGGFGSRQGSCTLYHDEELQCSADFTDSSSQGWLNPVTGKLWFAEAGGQTAVASPNASQCAALAADATCSAPVDTCTDSSPQTRIFNGVAVTQACWAWTRTYTCQSLTPANDCSSKTIPAGCTFAREECLDDPAPADPSQCKVHQEVYTCPIVSKQAASQYLCGGDVYCISGNCETIQRDASTEFKDALVAMHTLDEASHSLNTINYTLFKGAGQTCSKPVFGLANCCGGHGFPLIGNCSSADHLLAKQIDAGVTHYVGTYCSKSFIVCTSEAKSYCVFGSKLTRILQEQGRTQIGKSWASAKHPDCSGFTVAQFSQLDLSKMDFSEVYADFISAAKLPNEAATLTNIQSKIQAYYKH